MQLLEWITTHDTNISQCADAWQVSYSTLYNIVHRKARATYDRAKHISLMTSGAVSIDELCAAIPAADRPPAPIPRKRAAPPPPVAATPAAPTTGAASRRASKTTAAMVVSITAPKPGGRKRAAPPPAPRVAAAAPTTSAAPRRRGGA